MQTHTLRNKSKTTPIVRLTASFMTKMLAARPDSVSLVLARFIKNYATLTGKRPTLDYEQNMLLLNRADADENGQWSSPYAGLPLVLNRVHQCFIEGFLGAPPARQTMEEDLMIAERFFDLLDTQLKPSCKSA